MKKQLRKPENWQDFESLCKVLWGEIWNCPEIKKNGRIGQTQHGVDVYGTPEGESQYYGIQCKGKDDYTNAELTEKEINKEISKAKNFKPALKKFYFATTANKDSKIEEYIRIKDEESRKSGGFEIHLFSWEDIVDKIDENKVTHDWYVNSVGFKNSHSVSITFQDLTRELSFKPKLYKNNVSYKIATTREQFSFGIYSAPSFEDNRLAHLSIISSPQPMKYYIDGQRKNLSSCVFSIIIENDGNVQIENFKMYLNIKDAGCRIGIVNKQNGFSDLHPYDYNVTKYKNSNNCVFEPTEKILVQTDRIQTDKLCLRPTLETPQEIVIEYEFVAKDFNTSGELKIKIEPDIFEKNSIEETALPQESEVRLDNYFV